MAKRRDERRRAWPFGEVSPALVAFLSITIGLTLSAAPWLWPGLLKVLRPYPFGFAWAPIALGFLTILGLVVIALYSPASPHRMAWALGLERGFRFLWLGTISVLCLQVVATLLAFLFRTTTTRNLGNNGRTIVQLILMALSIRALLGPLLRDFRRGLRLSWSVWHVLWPAKVAPSRFSTPKEAVGRNDVLVFSDTHIAPRDESGTDLQTLEGDLPDRPVVSFVRRTIEAAAPKAVVLAGDVTDSGHVSSWRKAAALFQSDAHAIFAAPGNHDVHFRRFGRPAGRGAVAQGLIAIQSEEDADAPVTSYSDAEVAASLALVSSTGGATVDKESFPIRHDHAALSLSVIILNSNHRSSSSPITNAIGAVGRKQLAAAEKLAGGRPAGYGLLVVMHHHVLPPKRWFDRVTLMCVDADQVLDLAVRQRAEAIIHGHTHMPYLYRHEADGHALWIISCGSALYPAKGPFAKEVNTPSCVGLSIEAGRIKDIAMYRDTRSCADSADTGALAAQTQPPA